MIDTDNKVSKNRKLIMKPAYGIWISIPIALWLVVFAVFEAKAGEILIGTNWHHISQLDAGPPFNNDREDSVDHIGFHLMARTKFGTWEFYSGISAGRNTNLFSCKNCWDDGNAKVDTLLFFGIQKKVWSW